MSVRLSRTCVDGADRQERSVFVDVCVKKDWVGGGGVGALVDERAARASRATKTFLPPKQATPRQVGRTREGVAAHPLQGVARHRRRRRGLHVAAAQALQVQLEAAQRGNSGRVLHSTIEGCTETSWRDVCKCLWLRGWEAQAGDHQPPPPPTTDPTHHYPPIHSATPSGWEAEEGDHQPPPPPPTPTNPTHHCTHHYPPVHSATSNPPDPAQPSRSTPSAQWRWAAARWPPPARRRAAAGARARGRRPA